MKIQQFPWEVVALGAGAIVATALASSLTVKYFATEVQQKPFPKKWLRVGTVAHLAIYPIKSCKGIPVEEGIVTKVGLKGLGGELYRDRIFMVVNEKGVIQEQKDFPKLACITFSAQKFEITLSAPDVDDVCFELPPYSLGIEKRCELFPGDLVTALDCSDGPAAWLDSFLGSSGLRLVYHHTEHSQRHIREWHKNFPLMSDNDVGTFQNHSSYLLVAQESVAELNKALKRAVSFHNFRPTILIEGLTEPFVEVKWSYVKIGKEVIFTGSKPCERCINITVDQETGVKDRSGDPLKTLINKFKPEYDDALMKDLLKRQGIMGLQMGLHPVTPQNLTIRVGDPVYVALL